MANSSMGTQGAKFIVSGGISAVVDLGLTYLFQILLGMPATVARIIGFVFGTLTAYLINRRWTFQAEASTKRFLQVAVLYTVTAVVNIGGYKLLFLLLSNDLPDRAALLIAFVIAQGTATVINFFVQRIFIFRTTA